MVNMRDIRFRAWDKLDKKFVKYTIMTVEGLLGVSRPENYELMQYTGLKDKNGKEIYEGDILLVDGHRYCEVIWHKHIAGFDTRYIKGASNRILFEALENNQIETRCEVIGNIYENPELLNEN